MLLVAKPSMRNPFRLVRGTLHTRAYSRLFNSSRNLTQDSAGDSAIKKLFRLFWHYLPISKRGVFALKRNEIKTALIPFNSQNTQFHALYLERYRYGYEPEVSNLLDLVLRDDDVFYDIGANWGYFALFAASKPGFCGKVFAFEPLPSAFADLQQVVGSAGLKSVVRCMNVALSDCSREGWMSLPDNLHSGLARLNISSAGDCPQGLWRSKVGKEHNIRVAKMDDLQIGPPGVIKIDAEGSEYDILRGSELTLRQHKPIVIFESWSHPSQPNETSAPHIWLESIGYQSFVIGWRLNQSILMADNRALFREEPVELALRSFLPRERLIYQTKINCAAIHKDSFPRIKKLFKEISS